MIPQHRLHQLAGLQREADGGDPQAHRELASMALRLGLACASGRDVELLAVVLAERTDAVPTDTLVGLCEAMLAERCRRRSSDGGSLLCG